jgi:hypothetical protein
MNNSLINNLKGMFYDNPLMVNDVNEIDEYSLSDFDESPINLMEKKHELTVNQILENRKKKLHSKTAKWTREEDRKLKEIVLEKGTKNWKLISDFFNDKSPKQCFYRWTKVLKPDLQTVQWTEEEDNFIINWASVKGTSNWTNCAKHMKEHNRTPKNCKDRWYNKLSLDSKITTESASEQVWTPYDELLLVFAVETYGTSWSKIVKNFPPKNENQIKNKFYSILRKSANNHLNRIDSLPKINVFQLKSNDLMKYLPNSLQELKTVIGDTVYEYIRTKFKSENQNLDSKLSLQQNAQNKNMLNNNNKIHNNNNNTNNINNFNTLQNGSLTQNTQFIQHNGANIIQTNNNLNTINNNNISQQQQTQHQSQNILTQQNNGGGCQYSTSCINFDFYQTLQNNQNSLPHNRVQINMCLSCKNKLKEHIKKKIISKMISNQINNKPMYNPLNDSSLFDLDPYEVRNTSSKIGTIKDILSNFSQNLANNQY